MTSARPNRESWDLSIPVLTPRTCLYALDPVGSGTAGVERMGSYLARLAFAHCVTPRNLLELHFGFGGYKHMYPALAGFGHSAAAVVERVEALTGLANLSSLTLLPWKGAFSGTALLRRTRAWCPQCYEEQRGRGESVHDKLLWALQPVRVCARHRCDLIESCGGCAYHTRDRDLLTVPGYCPSCGTWLGLNRRRRSTSARRSRFEWQWEIWKAAAVGELLAAAPSLRAQPTTADVQAALERLCHQTGATTTAFYKAVGISQRHFYDCRSGKRRMPLDRFLRVAWSTGTRPLALLRGEFEAGPLRQAPETGKLPHDRPSSRAGVEERWERLERAARASLHRRQPVTIEHLAKELGVSGRYLRGVLPKELKDELVTRYKAGKVADRRQQLTVCREEISRILEELVASGVYPTNILVIRLLNERQIPSRKANHIPALISKLRAAILAGSS